MNGVFYVGCQDKSAGLFRDRYRSSYRKVRKYKGVRNGRHGGIFRWKYLFSISLSDSWIYTRPLHCGVYWCLPVSLEGKGHWDSREFRPDLWNNLCFPDQHGNSEECKLFGNVLRFHLYRCQKYYQKGDLYKVRRSQRRHPPKKVWGFKSGWAAKKSWREGMRSLASWTYLSSSGKSDFLFTIISGCLSRNSWL